MMRSEELKYPTLTVNFKVETYWLSLFKPIRLSIDCITYLAAQRISLIYVLI